MSKLQDFTFSPALRKETELMDFVQDVRNALNVGSTAFVAKTELIGQTAAISATTLFTPDVAWNFRISVYQICTVAGTGTLSSTIRWTDEAGSKSLSVAGNVDLSATTNGATGNEFIRANASAITFETAIAGLAGSPQYSIYIIVEQIG